MEKHIGYIKQKFQKYRWHVKAFIVNLLIALIGCAWYIMKNHGCMTWGNDVNDQVIPFLVLINNSVKSGMVNFNWSIDLGSAFMPTVYQYVGNPIVWITLLFPSTFIPYLIGPLYVVQFAFCGLFSYMYLQRFVKEREALVGSVLYSFSGFMLCFSEYYIMLWCVCTFPLLLISLEELIFNNRKWIFALCVFFHAFLNISVFVGEVVFLVFYYIFRAGDFRSFRKYLFRCIGEGTLGMLMAGGYVFPVLYNIMMNPRAKSTIGWKQMLFYSSPMKYLAIVKDIMFPNEQMSYPGTFLQWDFSTCSLYLPFVGIVLVVVFVVGTKKYFIEYKWLKYVILCSMVFLFVPVLNSSFMGFSATMVYHRWLYMPTLMMVLASCLVLEKDEIHLTRVAWIVFGVMLIFFVLCLVMQYGYQLEIIKYEFVFYVSFAIGLVSAFLFAVIVSVSPKKSSNLIRGGIFLSAALCMIYTFSIQDRVGTPGEKLAEKLSAMSQIKLSDDGYRLLSAENLEVMPAGTHGIGSFASVVEPSIFELYQALGLDRNVMTPMIGMYEEYFDLYSAKYYFCDLDEEDNVVQTIIDSTGKAYNVCEKDYVVPIGWGYDTYITRSEFDEFNRLLDYDYAALAMIHSLVIPDEQEEIISKRLTHTTIDELLSTLSMEERLNDFDKYRAECSEVFTTSTNGFYSEVNLEADKYIFYSVPNSRGWSAKVNGVEVPIVDICGLMAVPASKGDNQVEFTYHTPLFRMGMMVSVVSFVIWIIGTFRYSKKKISK